MEKTIKRVLVVLVIYLSISVVSLSLYGIHTRKNFGGVALRGYRYLHKEKTLEKYFKSIKNNMNKNNFLLHFKYIIKQSINKIGHLTAYILKQNDATPLHVAFKESAAFLRYSHLYAIPLDLLIAVANTESHFNPLAKSSHGSAGVMQVTWKVHEKTLLPYGFNSPDELHDPVLGIKAGSIILSRYIEKNKDLKTALGHYYGGSPEAYWSRVAKNLKRYRRYDQSVR